MNILLNTPLFSFFSHLTLKINQKKGNKCHMYKSLAYLKNLGVLFANNGKFVTLHHNLCN